MSAWASPFEMLQIFETVLSCNNVVRVGIALLLLSILANVIHHVNVIGSIARSCSISYIP